MITIDYNLFFKNRMWFGWWFSYAWSAEEVRLTVDSLNHGIWKRDPRYHWTPMILSSKTFGERPGVLMSTWSMRYGKI